MKRFIRQLGQGMTEYIIIVALIAIAAIGAYSFFGDVLTDQMGNMAQELGGTDATVSDVTLNELRIMCTMQS
ncbi:MAG: hypothetical protein O7D86_00920 [Proteobacteria bacterium]|nr:hypothetical protein [Pseudomonadota bacterium]